MLINKTVATAQVSPSKDSLLYDILIKYHTRENFGRGNFGEPYR